MSTINHYEFTITGGLGRVCRDADAYEGSYTLNGNFVPSVLNFIGNGQIFQRNIPAGSGAFSVTIPSLDPATYQVFLSNNVDTAIQIDLITVAATSPAISEPQSIAEAVKNLLNGAAPGTFSIAFTAKRKHVPLLDDTELQNVAVTVAARKQNTERIARNDSETKTLEIDIGIQKTVAGDPSSEDANVELDALDLFSEQIEGFFDEDTEVGFGATWSITQRNPLTDSDELQKKSMYMSLVTVTFWRAN